MSTFIFPNSSTGTVTDVNGQNGVVTLDADDVSAANKFLSNLTNPTSIAVDLLPSLDVSQGLGSALKRWIIAYVERLKDSSDVNSIHVQNRTLNTTSGTSALDYSSPNYIQDLVPSKLLNSASDPSSPAAGVIYYNTVSNKIKFYNGTTWETITSS